MIVISSNSSFASRSFMFFCICVGEPAVDEALMVGPYSIWAKEFLFLFLAFFNEKLQIVFLKKLVPTS
jgi:hypothetical protein